jgi:hypothetical protein
MEETCAQPICGVMSSASKIPPIRPGTHLPMHRQGSASKTRLAVPSSTSVLKQICPTLRAHPAWCTCQTRATRQVWADENRSWSFGDRTTRWV